MTLALQGGGSHGAFTWGVLDRLLEDERIVIEGISGASAGAMNAVACAYGHMIGGRDGARRALADFWNSVARKAPFNFAQDDVTALDIGAQSHPSQAFTTMMSLGRFFSPYQLNPFDINPLRDILANQIDFERLRTGCKTKLFVATTQVSSGRLKLFQTRQLTLDVLLASACLPAVHHAVEIDGEAYWDGGLTANPPLYPLLQKCAASDVMVVLLHPYPRPGVPMTADDIGRRLNEMGFSSTFFTELQGVALAKQEAERSWFSFGRLERRLRSLNMHLIDSQELMSQLAAHSKMNTKPAFIKALHDNGRSQAHAWLEKNFRQIGVRSSFPLGKLLA